MKTSTKIIKQISTLFFIIAIAFSANIVYAQQDTTKFELGGIELIFVEKIKRMEEGISNLENGKTIFEKEIAKSEAKIAEAEKKIEAEKALQSTLETQEQKEISEVKIKKQEQIIAENEKKIEAFEKGLEEIADGIEELEDELAELDEDFDPESDDVNAMIHKIKKHKKYNGHWAGFEVGLSNFITSDNKIPTADETGFMQLNAERSLGFAINFMEYNLPIAYRTFGLTTGMGLNWNHFNLEQNVDIYEDELGVMQGLEIDPEVRDYKSNILNMAYLTIPLIAELQIPIGKEKLFLGVGATGSMRLWSKNKQKYKIGDNKYKDKTMDDFQLSPFRYGATIRLGYGPVALFANYEMVSLFNANKGPELYPITVGLRIINF